MTFRILVFSDSHRSLGKMCRTVQRHQPDLVIHLGDVMPDADKLSTLFPRQALVKVPGNCDGWTDEPLQKILEIQGKRILFSHGHIWRVKYSYDAAIAAARAEKADLVMFGHTHVAYCKQEEDGLWVLNPGSARSSYALVTLTDGTLDCKLLE